VRLAVYLDYVHRRADGRVYAPRAFALFVAGLRPAFDRLVVAGRVDPKPGTSHYPLADDVEFLELPWYASAARPGELGSALGAGLRRWDHVLRGADAAWVLGPQGLALPLVALALARGRRVALGVRQDLPAYARTRHPGRRPVHVAADVLEGAYRALARRVPAVVVGPALAERYAGGREVLPLTVSLVREAELDAPPPQRDWDADELRVLSVGRLEQEKNPLLLADVLAGLHARDPRWRLVVAGEGPLEGELRARLAELGVAHAADLCGYVPSERLRAVYREAHAFLHVSWTEGLPQVLFEAFAARLPVVATDVGSVAEAGGEAVLLVPPGDPETPVARLGDLAADPALRARLVAAGLERLRPHTMEAELRRAAAFLGGRPEAIGTAPRTA
jgi:glycosyltransferase involved in cell wall biosynthesis